MSKLSVKQLLVNEVFNPNDDGVSEWVSREILDESPLKWGNNGIGRHGIYFGDNRFIWEKQGKGKITALRTIGFSDDYLYGAVRPIRNDIHKYIKSHPCVVCGSRSDLRTDHKNDLYNDPRVLNAETQTVEDFQCLCNHCNLQKRQVALRTILEGKRIGATTIPTLAVWGIDFIEGDETIDTNDIYAMKGTYWYDPVAFMKEIRSKLLTQN